MKPEKPPCVAEEVSTIGSSPEDVESDNELADGRAETPGKGTSSGSGTQPARPGHYCTSSGVARVEGDVIVNAKVTPGASGFMMARFPGEEPFAT